MSRYLVTGATGFLGGHLVPQLIAEGHAVVALCRKPEPGLERSGASVVLGDVLEAASVKAAARGCEGVFHCAGMVSRRSQDAEAMLRLHVEGTRTVLDAAREAGVRRAVVASTSGTVAVSTEARELSEDEPIPRGLIARWPYYRSKLYAEQEAFDRNAPDFAVICVNPSLLLGPGDAHNSSTDDVRLFLERKVQAVPAGGMSFVDARDAAGAMVSAMRRGRAGERYLVGGCNCTIREFFGRLERVSGVKAPWIPMPKSPEIAKQAVRLMDRLVDRIGGTPVVNAQSVDIAQHYWYVDWSKAKRELGFAPRDPTQTLRDTVEDLRSRGVVWPAEPRRNVG
jgi:dihydroflavonol-4-reductase